MSWGNMLNVLYFLIYIKWILSEFKMLSFYKYGNISLESDNILFYSTFICLEYKELFEKTKKWNFNVCNYVMGFIN